MYGTVVYAIPHSMHTIPNAFVPSPSPLAPPPLHRCYAAQVGPNGCVCATGEHTMSKSGFNTVCVSGALL